MYVGSIAFFYKLMINIYIYRCRKQEKYEYINTNKEESREELKYVINLRKRRFADLFLILKVRSSYYVHTY